MSRGRSATVVWPDRRALVQHAQCRAKMDALELAALEGLSRLSRLESYAEIDRDSFGWFLRDLGASDLPLIGVYLWEPYRRAYRQQWRDLGGEAS